MQRFLRAGAVLSAVRVSLRSCLPAGPDVMAIVTDRRL